MEEEKFTDLYNDCLTIFAYIKYHAGDMNDNQKIKLLSIQQEIIKDLQ